MWSAMKGVEVASEVWGIRKLPYRGSDANR